MKFEKISHLIWHLLSKRQIKGEILQKILAFSEYMNFILSKRQIMWEIVPNFVAFLENLNFKEFKQKKVDAKIIIRKLKM